MFRISAPSQDCRLQNGVNDNSRDLKQRIEKSYPKTKGQRNEIEIKR